MSHPDAWRKLKLYGGNFFVVLQLREIQSPLGLDEISKFLRRQVILSKERCGEEVLKTGEAIFRHIRNCILPNMSQF